MSYIGKSNAGNPILLAKDPIGSAVSSITFDGVFDNAYTEYLVTLFNMTVSSASGVQIYWKWRNSGSDITGTHYRAYMVLSPNSANGQIVSNPTTSNYVPITDYSMGTDSTREALNSLITIYPRSTGPKFTVNDSMFVADSSNVYSSEFIGMLDDATQVDGFSIYASSGNIATGGEVCVYGIKK